MESKPCTKRLRISELNPHLLCALCGGYLIDATTIIECLHSFCKTCIVRYLDTSNYCPICEVLIHKTRPWQNIRPDHALQNAVYKMVPGLFQSEMKRRKEFYEKNIKEEKLVKPSLILGDLGDTIIFSKDEQFSISIEYSPNGKPLPETPNPSTKALKRQKSQTPQHPYVKRYLQCPADFKIGLLKKFIRAKFSLPHHVMVDLFYDVEPLSDTYSLIDIAYIYLYKRDCVLRLFYSFYELPVKSRPSETITKTVAEKVKEKHESRGREMRERAAEREKEEGKYNYNNNSNSSSSSNTNNTHKMASSNAKRDNSTKSKPTCHGKMPRKRDGDQIIVSDKCLGPSPSSLVSYPIKQTPGLPTKTKPVIFSPSPSPSLLASQTLPVYQTPLSSKRKSVEIYGSTSQSNNNNTYIPEKKLKKETTMRVATTTAMTTTTMINTGGPSMLPMAANAISVNKRKNGNHNEAKTDSVRKNKTQKMANLTPDSYGRSHHRVGAGYQHKPTMHSDLSYGLELKANRSGDISSNNIRNNNNNSNNNNNNNNNNTPCPNNKFHADVEMKASTNVGQSLYPTSDRVTSLPNQCPRKTNSKLDSLKSDKDITVPLSISIGQPANTLGKALSSSSTASNLVYNTSRDSDSPCVSDDVQVIKVEIMDSPSPSKSTADLQHGSSLDEQQHGQGVNKTSSSSSSSSSSSISFKLVKSFQETPAESVQQSATSSQSISREATPSPAPTAPKQAPSIMTTITTIPTINTISNTPEHSLGGKSSTPVNLSRSNPPDTTSASNVSTALSHHTPTSTSEATTGGLSHTITIIEIQKPSSPVVSDKNNKDHNELSKTIPASNEKQTQMKPPIHSTTSGPVSKSMATQVSPDSSVDKPVPPRNNSPKSPTKLVDSQVQVCVSNAPPPTANRCVISTCPEDLSSARCTPIDMVVTTTAGSNLKSTGIQVSVHEPPAPSPPTLTHSLNNVATADNPDAPHQKLQQRSSPYDFKSTQCPPSPSLKSNNFGGQIDFVVNSSNPMTSQAVNCDDPCPGPTDLSCKSSKVSVSLSPSGSRPNSHDHVTTSTSIATQTDHTNDKNQHVTSLASDTPTISVSLSDSETNSPPSTILKLPSDKTTTVLETFSRKASALACASQTLDLTSPSDHNNQPPPIKPIPFSKDNCVHQSIIPSTLISQSALFTTSTSCVGSDSHTSKTNTVTSTLTSSSNKSTSSTGNTVHISSKESSINVQAPTSTTSLNLKVTRDSVGSTPSKTYISIPDVNAPKLTIVNNEAAAVKFASIQKKNSNTLSTPTNNNNGSNKFGGKAAQQFNKHLTAIAKPIEPLKLTVTLSPNDTTKEAKSTKRSGDNTQQQQNTTPTPSQHQLNLSKSTSTSHNTPKSHSVSRLIASPSCSSSTFPNASSSSSSSSSSSPSSSTNPSPPPTSPKTPPCTVIQTTKISTLIPKSSSISSKAGGSKHSFSYPSAINTVPSSRSFLQNSHPTTASSRFHNNHVDKMKGNVSTACGGGGSRKSLDKDSVSQHHHHHTKHSSKHNKVTDGRVVKTTPTTKTKSTRTIPPLSIPKSCLISPTLKLQRSPGSTDHYNIYPLPAYHLAPNHHHNGDTSGGAGSVGGSRQRSKDSTKHHNGGGAHPGSRTPTSPNSSNTKDAVFIGGEQQRQQQQRVPSIKISDINRNPIIVGSGKGSPSNKNNSNISSTSRNSSTGTTTTTTTNNNSNNPNNNSTTNSNTSHSHSSSGTSGHSLQPHPRSNSQGSSSRSSSSSEGSISSSSSSGIINASHGNIRSLSRGSSGSSRSADSPDSLVVPLRSPIKEVMMRRPTAESDFLLGHGWHPHSAAAAEFLLNAFKIPAVAAAAAAAKYHNLHYDTDAMPLDYSQSSSKL